MAFAHDSKEVISLGASPNFAVEAAKVQYEKASAASSTIYVWNGKDSVYKFYKSLTSTQLVENILTESKAIEVLDIGTGEAGVLKFLKAKHGAKVNATGISAINYFKGKEEPTFCRYLVGDAHDVFKLGIKPKQFDLIVSQHTLEHLSDPVKVLVDAYRALKYQGILVFDLVPFYGLTLEESFVLLNYLRDQGYKLAAYCQESPSNIFSSEHNLIDHLPGQWMTLVIQKTKSELVLPLQYIGSERDMYELRVLYRLPLLKDCKLTINQDKSVQYQSSKQNRKTSVTTVMGYIGPFAVPKKQLGTQSELFDADLSNILDARKIHSEKSLLWDKLHCSFFTYPQVVGLRGVNKRFNQVSSELISSLQSNKC